MIKNNNTKKGFLLLIFSILISVPFINAAVVGVVVQLPGGVGSVNSSNYWDNLDTPADILGSQIVNDLGWVTSASGNSSFNQTLTDTLYAPIGSGNVSWNQSHANTLYAPLGSGNFSWNQSFANTLYISQAEESNLNVNSSGFWDNLGTINATQMENSGGELNIKQSWFTSLWNAIFGTKDTDDLSEGSINLYDNQTWNETKGDTLYAPIGSGNSSWNQTFANTLYAPNTTAGIQALLNSTGIYSTFNSTYDANQANASFNQSLTDNLYADISVTGDNSSWNQAVGDTRYLPHTVDTNESVLIKSSNASWTTTFNATYDAKITDNSSWNQGVADTLYADISVTGGNASWNQTHANTLYIAQAEESNLNVNSSDFWDNLGTINSTQMENSGGELNIKQSWFTTLWNIIFGTKDTDDLSEGSSNKYDNQTWNETKGDTLYADISVTGDNASWNQGLADGLYADISVVSNPFDQDLNTTNDVVFNNINANENVTASWFNGQFNWTSGDSWNNFDGSTLTFNETHLNKTLHIFGFNETDSLTVFYDERYLAGELALYFYNSTDPHNSSYTIMNTTIPRGAEQRDSFTGLTNGDNLLTKRILSTLNITILEKGAYNQHTTIDYIAGTKDVNMRSELYILYDNGTETLIGQSPPSIGLIVGIYQQIIWTGVINEDIIFPEGSHLTMYLYATVSGSGQNPDLDLVVGADTAARLDIGINPTDIKTIEVDPFSLHKNGDVVNEGNQNWGGFNLSNIETITVKDWSNLTNEFNDSWTTTFNATYDANQGNASWNQSFANTLYISQGDEANLNTNSSDFWDNLNTPNSTQMENSGGELNLKESWLTTLWNKIFSTKDTDDLSEGSSNKYDNTSWSQSVGDTLYADIGVTGDNSSWNQGEADGRYISQLEEANLNVNSSDFWDGLDTPLASWIVTFNATYDSKVTDNSSWSQSLADGLYADISVTGGNASWNQSFANSLYLPHTVDTWRLNFTDYYTKSQVDNNLSLRLLATDQRYNETQLIVDSNASWTSTFNSTYDAKVTDNSSWNQGVADGRYVDLGNTNYLNNATFNQALTDTLYADISVTGDNSSWNQSLGDSLYLAQAEEANLNVNSSDFWDNLDEPLAAWISTFNATYDAKVTDNSSWNQGLADTLYADISVTGDNSSWNQGAADGRYIAQAEEANLNVNSSDFWDNLGTINATQMENSGGTLNILVSWFTSRFNSLFSGKDTDDLTEGSSNKYDNTSWSQTKGDTLYADISVIGDNSSWNQVLADGRYADISIDGTVTSVAAGDGLDFSTITSTGSVTLGTPSTLTSSTTDAVTATSHTHAITESGFAIAASQITAGTFGAGNYVITQNLTLEELVFENDVEHKINDNSTCVKIFGDTSILEVC